MTGGRHTYNTQPWDTGSGGGEAWHTPQHQDSPGQIQSAPSLCIPFTKWKAHDILQNVAHQLMLHTRHYFRSLVIQNSMEYRWSSSSKWSPTQHRWWWMGMAGPYLMPLLPPCVLQNLKVILCSCCTYRPTPFCRGALTKFEPQNKFHVLVVILPRLLLCCCCQRNYTVVLMMVMIEAEDWSITFAPYTNILYVCK